MLFCCDDCLKKKLKELTCGFVSIFARPLIFVSVVSEVWTECMKLRIMKAMFDCDTHLAKKMTTCLNDLSLAPSLS